MEKNCAQIKIETLDAHNIDSYVYKIDTCCMRVIIVILENIKNKLK